MGKKVIVEYRYYQIPENEDIIPLTGPSWTKGYGDGKDRLHFHNYYEVGICLSGSGTMILDEREEKFYPYCISAIPPNALHTTISDNGQESSWEWMYFDVPDILMLLYPGDELQRGHMERNIYGRLSLMKPGEYPDHLFTLVQKILKESQNKLYMYRESIRFSLGILLIEIIRVLDKMEPLNMNQKEHLLIHPALEYVLENYMNPVKIGDLAGCCGISEGYFRKKFFQYMNMRPLEYLNFVRIQKSCELLQTTEDTEEMIANKVGYEDITTFIRNFRKIMEDTPLKWKQKYINFESKLKNYNITALKGWE